MNLNEECLLLYLSNPLHSESFVMECEQNNVFLNCQEYNEVTWLFISY